jgi:Ca2+-binding RTX toxin-like protein
VHLAPSRHSSIRLLVSVLLVSGAFAIAAPTGADAAPSCAEGPQTVGSEIIGTPCADTIRAPRNITTVRGEGGDDVLFGQRGNDSLFGGDGADRLYGGIGDDRLRGGIGDDLLSGGFGADSLDGEAGDDLARGDATVDRIGDSGGGTDTLSFATGATPGFPNQGAFFDNAGFPPDVGRGVYVDLGGSFANNGLAPSGGGVDEPLAPEATFANFEIVIGTPFDDYIVGTSDAETFYGGGGADLIDGGGGVDVAYGGAEGDGCIVATAHECESSDEEVDPRDPGMLSAGVMAPQSSSGPALFFSGTDGDDDIVASYASGQVSFTVGGSPAGSFPAAEAPDSVLVAGLDGGDTLSATGFPEMTSVVLLGGEGDDDLTSGATEDADIDGAGDDAVSAGAGDDAVPNNGGGDDLDAGAGEDLFIDNAVCDGDQLDGGPDRDNANWANFGSAISIDMAAHSAGLVGGSGQPSCPSGALTSLTGLEDIEGTSLADTMVGDVGDNQLLGRPGADTFHAAAGNDSILANSGTPGDDPDATIDCGTGFDTAQIDRPANGPDPTPTDCEAVEERDPNSFRPPDTPPDTPDTSIATQPPALTNSTTAEFSFSAGSAAGAGFECQLDAGAFAACTSPKTYSGLSGDGAAAGTAHTFQVRAKNAAGTDLSPASYTWTVDTVRPAVSLTDRPPDPSAAGDAAFSFTADEPAAFACGLAGPRPFGASACSSGIAYPGLPDGRYTFEVAATDLAGNLGDPVSYGWRIESPAEPSPPSPPPPPPVDRTRPQTRIAGGTPKWVRAGRDGRLRVALRFSSNERGASFVCRLDRRRVAPCVSPRAYTVAVGVHTFRVTATDAEGNTDLSPALFRFRVGLLREPEP